LIWWPRSSWPLPLPPPLLTRTTTPSHPLPFSTRFWALLLFFPPSFCPATCPLLLILILSFLPPVWTRPSLPHVGYLSFFLYWSWLRRSMWVFTLGPHPIFATEYSTGVERGRCSGYQRKLGASWAGLCVCPSGSQLVLTY
jgi:hypothetical protein